MPCQALTWPRHVDIVFTTLDVPAGKACQDVEMSECALFLQLVAKHLASKVLFLEGRKHALLVRDACRNDGLLLRRELPGLELLGVDPAEVTASIAD